MTKAPEKLGRQFYRDHLSKQGQVFYDCINAQLLRKDYSGSTHLPISDAATSASDSFSAYKAIRDDHPEYFFLGWQCQLVRKGETATLQYPMLYAPDIIARIDKQLRKSICQIVRGTATLPLVEREMLVYERIAKKLSYTNNNDVRDHNIVGPVLMSAGVCEGHNALLLLCLRRIGIPCIKVYGKVKAGGWHCWAIAWINGTAVHCDVTWDGPKEGAVCFNYFNLSDEQISVDHFEFKGTQIPACTSEAFSFYSYYNLCARSFGDVRRLVKGTSRKGMSPIRIHFEYEPQGGKCSAEVERALFAERIYGYNKLCFNPRQKNILIIKEKR